MYLHTGEPVKPTSQTTTFNIKKLETEQTLSMVLIHDDQSMNHSSTEVSRPPKSPSVIGVTSVKIMTTTANTSTPPLPPPRLQRSLSAPIGKIIKEEEPCVKIYDGIGDDGSCSNNTFDLAWLKSALENSGCCDQEEKKEESNNLISDTTPNGSVRKHRRGRAFSWDGGGMTRGGKLVKGKKLVLKSPETPATVCSDSSTSPESSPEASDPNCWSLCKSFKKSGSHSKRGKPPKSGRVTPSPPLLSRKLSRRVGSVDSASLKLKKKQQQKPKSRSEVHEQVSSCLKNGDYETALSLSENILQEDQRRYGHHHASVGIALHNIGMVHMHACRYDMSESTFYQAVLVRKNALGPEHLDVAASLTKLATVRLHLGRFDDALSSFLEALRITRRHLGNSHSCVAQLQSHIGCVYYEVGEYRAAQATFEDALDIYRALWASGMDIEAAMVAVTEMLCNIGSIQSKRKNFPGAISSFSEALDLQRRVMGQDHPRVIATLDNLGHAFSKNKDYGQALLCYNEMLRAQEAFYGTYNDECYRTAKKQNLMYEKQKSRESCNMDSVQRVPAVPVTPDAQDLNDKVLQPYL